LDVAARQVGRLTELVGRLMDVSALRAGRIDLELEETDLAQIAREVVGRFQEEAAKAQTPLTLVADAPVICKWDRLRIDQVMTNLIANAIRLGAGGAVEVTVEGVGARARLVVRDHGIGIMAADKVRVFQSFERAVSAQDYGGLGIGLYITNQIVAAH